MIELKYTFNTTAELLAHLSATAGQAISAGVVNATTTAVTKPDPKPTKATKAETTEAGNAQAATTARTEPTAEAEKVVVQETKAESSAAIIEYPVLQKAVFALAEVKLDGETLPDTIGRRSVMALAASFKVKTFKELAPEHFAAALAAVVAKMEEIKQAEMA